jgi:hypothetical protein
MIILKKTSYFFLVGILLSANIHAQSTDSLRRKQIRDSLNNIEAGKTEFYSPVPPVVTPGNYVYTTAPSDAIVLFDGSNLDQWVSAIDSSKNAAWFLTDTGMTVNKKVGDIQTRAKFTDFQLHIEYRIPTNISGSGQSRGNSGIFLAALPWWPGGYELQLLDNYKNTTYVNGQVGSFYKQAVPLVNACRKPGEWQTFDVIWTAPRFNDHGILSSPARATDFHNGVMVQNTTNLLGDTPDTGQPHYRVHGAAPIKLQSHGDPSEPISYRNIWLRPL